MAIRICHAMQVIVVHIQPNGLFKKAQLFFSYSAHSFALSSYIKYGAPFAPLIYAFGAGLTLSGSASDVVMMIQ